MKIDSIDFFYLTMPQVLDIGDGSQDALLVRITRGACGLGRVRSGTAGFDRQSRLSHVTCPCKPVQASVLGQSIDGVDDIRRIGNLVRANSLDLLQADHTLSGIDIALWDLLGRRLDEPVWKLLGYAQSYPKMPYASVLFGNTAQETLAKAKRIRALGFRAAKFGWGPFGTLDVADDESQLQAAREGIGEEGVLLVDVGTIWNDDLARARTRLPALKRTGAVARGAFCFWSTLRIPCTVAGKPTRWSGRWGGLSQFPHGQEHDRFGRSAICSNRRRSYRRYYRC